MEEKKKQAESLRQLFKSRKFLSSKFGKVNINFSSPILLDSFLETISEQTDKSYDIKLVNNISHRIMQRINEAAVITPCNFISAILIAAPNKAMSEDDILKTVSLCRRILSRQKFSDNIVISLPSNDKETLYLAEKIIGLKRFKHPGGDILYFTEEIAIVQKYYSNNILHTLCLPSIVAAYYQHNDETNLDLLLSHCLCTYGFLKNQWYLPWDNNQAKAKFKETISLMVEIKMLKYEDQNKIIKRAEIFHPEFLTLKTLAEFTMARTEKYAIFCSVLNALSKDGKANLLHFKSQCELLATRISLLSGQKEIETR